MRLGNCLEHEETDLKVFDGFVHRTFQAEDARGFMRALRGLMETHGSLEAAFLVHAPAGEGPAAIKPMLAGFHRAFMAQTGVAPRTKKHVANPDAGSAAKRLNMFLRWMVRPSTRGVDLGLWSSFKPQDLHIPLDVHTSNVGRKLAFDAKSQRLEGCGRVDGVLAGNRSPGPGPAGFCAVWVGGDGRILTFAR